MPLQLLGREEPERTRACQYIRLCRFDGAHGRIDQSRARILMLAHRQAMLAVALAEGLFADLGRSLALHDVHQFHEVGGDLVFELASQARLPLDLHGHGGSCSLDRRLLWCLAHAVVERARCMDEPSSAATHGPLTAGYRDQALAQLIIFERSRDNVVT